MMIVTKEVISTNDTKSHAKFLFIDFHQFSSKVFNCLIINLDLSWDTESFKALIRASG